MKARQIEWVRRALLHGDSINSVIASAYGIWRLSSIIHRLRQRGWPVQSIRHHGNGMASYSLPAGWKPTSNPN